MHKPQPYHHSYPPNYQWLSHSERPYHHPVFQIEHVHRGIPFVLHLSRVWIDIDVVWQVIHLVSMHHIHPKYFYLDGRRDATHMTKPSDKFDFNTATNSHNDAMDDVDARRITTMRWMYED